MGKQTHLSVGRFILQIALGVMLAVAGIWALQGAGDAAANAFGAVFSGDIAKILKIVFGVVELLCGLFLVIELFAGDVFGKLDNVLMLIVIIVWIVAIVLMDFLAKGGLFNSFNGKNFLAWIYTLASHLIVLGAMIYLKD